MAKTQVGVSDVAIEKINIESSHGSVDVRGIISELNIYEDIFSNSLKADLTLTEAYNLPYKLPIIGEETLNIELSLEGTSGVERGAKLLPPTFFLYDLNNRLNHEEDKDLGTPKVQTNTLNII